MPTWTMMGIVGATLNLVLWGAVLRALHRLPLRVWKVAQRQRAADEARALDVLQAAAASRLGGLVIGVQTYHDQLANLARTQVAEAEVRTRRTERRAAATAVALDAASALVRDLRALTEQLPRLEPHRALPSDPAPTADPEERTTVEMPFDATAPSTVPGPDRPPVPSRLRLLTASMKPLEEERLSCDRSPTTVQTHPLPSRPIEISGGPR